MSLFQLIATAATSAAGPASSAAPAGAQPSGLVAFLIQFAPLILLGIFLMFMMSSAKRKQERERTALLGSLKRGDKIRLIGGEYGSVIEVKDKKVQVKVDESSNTKIWYSKDAVQAIEKDEEAK